MIKIVVDAMGGDFAPVEQVKGSVAALEKNKDVSLILVGDETQIKGELANYQYDASRLEIVHTTETIGMEEVPTKAVKTKKDSSLVVAFRMLKEGKADGLVSSGSTGAVLTAGVLILGRLKGVSRPALCPAIPNYRGEGTLICDCGANLECKPVNLLHFAVMASAYAEAVYEKHYIIREFLTALGVSAGCAAEDACKMEHLVSEETFLAMKKFLQNRSFWSSGPCFFQLL